MQAIIKGSDREHLFESFPVLALVGGMAIVAAIFMMVAVLGLMTTL